MRTRTSTFIIVAVVAAGTPQARAQAVAGSLAPTPPRSSGGIEQVVVTATKTRTLLQESLLPHCQYYAYLEVGDESGSRFGPSSQGTTLWRTYKTVKSSQRFVMRRVNQRSDIYPVFRDLFQKNQDAARAAP